MSGGTTTQASQSTQVNQIPQWMTDAGQQNYAFAQQVAEQPLQQYQGQMVADVSPQTQQSWNVAANSGNVGADQYNASTAGYLGALAQNPMQVNPQTLAGTDLSPYMNPYTQSVINATMPIMQQQNALSQNQQANAANSSNAFGGSRQGIQQGVAQAQGAQNIGQMLAQLNQANYGQAVQGATGDITRNLQAQQGNQAEQQAKINSDIAASQGLMNTGDAMSKNNVANFNMLQSAGAGQSMQAQNQINAQMAKFNQAFNYPQQQLGTLLSALGMTPHDTSSSSQSTQQTTTPTDWASIISKGAGAASDIYGMLPSDRRLKKDISKVGEGPGGIPAYSYRFKGAPPSSPKVVGPMAQDVQKVVPEAVKKIQGSGGKLAIHMPTLDAATTPRGYAAGTAFVSPPLTNFTPPSSPGVVKGISAMSAFRPPVRLPRGAGMPKMQKFADGSANVQPDMDDAELGSQIMGDDGSGDIAGGLKNISSAFGGGKGGAKTPDMKQSSGGWNAPSMGYALQGFAGGIAQVPGFGSTDTVPSMLTPGEAVLTPDAAAHVGRSRIAQLNALMPPRKGAQATSMPRAGSRGIVGALANTKLRPKIAGGLSG
jgi:hypothetical protein